MTETILAADVGNTRAKFALLKRTSDSTLPAPMRTVVWSYESAFSPTLLQDLTFDRFVIAGSHYGHIDEIVQAWPAELPQPRVIRSARELPIELQVDAPDLVGVDRVLNALAARCEQPGVPAIVIDSGTATTIDVVSDAGVFLGGAILPGYELSAHALHDYTNKLPLIPLKDILGDTPEVIGKNTYAALRSGLIWGHVGAVNEIVQRITNELQHDSAKEPAIYLTGGAAPLLKDHLGKTLRERPQLTLQGLAHIANPLP